MTALKTVSARIRGSKSDLEELGEDVPDLANGFSKYAKELQALTGFDIMADSKAGTFKDIYDIFDGLAGVWDKLSDTQQARVAEILGGTRQLQVISSILGNWKDAAGAYQDAMESAGTATEANAIYMDSIEGKVGQLKATFQELSSTLISSDFIKQFVELGTGLLEILNGVAKLIDAVGGLNTVLVATVGIIATINSQAIWNMITVTLPAAITKLSAIFSSFNLQNLGAAVSLFFESIRAGNGVISSFTSVVGAATVGINTFKLALGAATLIITGIVIALQKAKQHQEEVRQATIDAAKDAKELSSDIADLIGKYLELSDAVKTDKSAKDELISTQDDLIKKLDLEKDRIRDLTDEYGSLTEAIKAAALEKLRESERDLLAGVNQTESDVLEKVSFSKIKAVGGMMDGLFGTDAKTRKEQVSVRKALDALAQAGYISDGSYSKYTDSNGKKYTQGYEIHPTIGLDESNVNDVVKLYRDIGSMLDIVNSTIGADNMLYDDLYELYNTLAGPVGAYSDAISALNANLSEQYMLESLVGKELPRTDAEFKEYRNSVVAAAQGSGEFIGSNTEIADAIDDILKKQPAFAGFYQDVASAVNGIGSAISSSGASSVVEQIAKVEAEINDIGKVLGEFSKSGVVSAATLDTLRETFGNCEEFQNFVDVMSNSNSTMAQAQTASNALAKEWINKLNILSLVNEETADSVEALLELTGVTNAHEVVEAQLNNVRAQAWLETNKLTNSTADEIATKLTDIGATDELRKAVLNHKFAIEAAKISTDTYSGSLESQIGVLIATANAAGIATSSISSLAKAQALVDRYESGELKNSRYWMNNNAGSSKSRYEERLEELAKEAQGAFTKLLNPEVPISITVPTVKSGSSSTSGNSDNNSSSKDVEKYIADLDRLYNKKEKLRQQQLADSRIADQIARTDDSSVDGLKERIRLTELYIVGLEEENRRLHDISGALKNQQSELDAIGEQMVRDFGGGNVDLLNRPQLLLDDGSIATVLTSWQDYDMGDKRVSIQFTPILPNGEILDDDTLYSYLDELADNVQSEADILSRDSTANGGLGIVMRVNAGLDFSPGSEEFLNEEAWGEQLHRAQEQYYDLMRSMGGLYDWDTARAEILDDINKFQQNYGLEIQYNPETNDLMFNDLLKIQDLREDMSKTYDTEADRQEAQNKRIKQAEEDWGKIESKVEECRERSAEYEENVGNVHEKLKEQVDTYKQIVDVASSIVDEVQSVYEILQKAADEYAANDGFISVDTFQDITAAGLEYMRYITDENGLLKMERENIKALIKAKTEQMALNAAEAYVQRVINSTKEGAIESTDRLTLAQDKLTTSTWDYLETQLSAQRLSGALTDEQYEGALHNLRTYRALLVGVDEDFNAHVDDMTKANEAMDKILEYTIELIKQQVQDEIDGLNDLVDQYDRLIEAKKKALDKTKEEDDYADEMLEKTKKLAKLRTDADLLRLAANSGDRSAEAKLAKNLEEQSELQKEIDEKQRDHSIEAQKEALDTMADNYKEQKKDEIDELQKSISSQQKLYDKAIAYIDSHWDTLYTELLNWNYEYGSTIDDEITQNWVLATNALEKYKMSYSELTEMRNAEKYGTYDTTINDDGTATIAQTSPTQNDIVGKDVSSEVRNIVTEMQENSDDWNSTGDPKAHAWLENENMRLAGEIEKLLNIKLSRVNGTWYLPDGRKLYDVYDGKHHTGGIVGGGTIAENEKLALLQSGEPVISNAHKQELFDLVDFAAVLSNRLGDISPVGLDLVSSARNESLMERLMEAGSDNVPSIHFGDVYIYGGNEETVRKHKEVSREFANEVLKYLRVKP